MNQRYESKFLCFVSQIVHSAILLIIRFESLQIEVGIYHGGRLISAKAHSPLAKVTRSFFCSVVWDKW